MKLRSHASLWIIMICVAIALTGIISVYATSSKTANSALTVEKTEVNVGDEFTVVISNNLVKGQAFGIYLSFNNSLVECVDIKGCDGDEYLGMYKTSGKSPWVDATVGDSVEDTNNDGIFSFAVMSADEIEYDEGKVATLTFKAKATGEVSFVLNEDTTSDSGYAYLDVVETKTLTITAPHTCGGNEMTPVDGKAATCPEAGYKPYYECSCGKFYEDAEAETLIGDEDALAAWKAVNGAGYIPATGEHDYNNAEHKCACGDVQKFTLKFTKDNGTIKIATSMQVPYGAKVVEYLTTETIEPWYSNEKFEYGVYKFDGVWAYDDGGERFHLESNTTMPAGEFVLIAEYSFTGWREVSEEGPWYYFVNAEIQKTGWTLINEADFTKDGTGSAWYYLDPTTGYRATGVTRVPYPTVKIDGVSYEADAEAIEYSASKGEIFIDGTSALFGFSADGKFQNKFTGLTTYKDATRYAKNGMLTWHPGFVTVDNTLYYFIGDVNEGGNKFANGETYITRPNGVEGFKVNDIVTFVDGQVKSDLDGIVNGYYYENGKLAYGKGLVALDANGETKYIYVRSSGKIATGDYWITNTNGLPVKAKMYNFGTDGYLQNPVDPSLNGVVDGYYYVNGSVEYGAGLVEWNGDIYYVRSNGQVATGTYYVTNLNNYDGTEYKVGDKLVFDKDGKLLPAKNGVIEGYYYIDNAIACGAGLIESNGDIYYVRSNGQVATGTYYVTNVANYKGTEYKAGDKLVFAEDGKLITK